MQLVNHVRGLEARHGARSELEDLVLARKAARKPIASTFGNSPGRF